MPLQSLRRRAIALGVLRDAVHPRRLRRPGAASRASGRRASARCARARRTERRRRRARDKARRVALFAGDVGQCVSCSSSKAIKRPKTPGSGVAPDDDPRARLLSDGEKSWPFEFEQVVAEKSGGSHHGREARRRAMALKELPKPSSPDIMGPRVGSRAWPSLRRRGPRPRRSRARRRASATSWIRVCLDPRRRHPPLDGGRPSRSPRSRASVTGRNTGSSSTT